MCTCEACHCSFAPNELVGNLCSECTEIINLFKPLGFIETNFNKNIEYWYVTDDFNKFVSILFKPQPIRDSFNGIFQDTDCEETLEAQYDFILDYEKDVFFELAKTAWYDKYKELMPLTTDRYRLFDSNSIGLNVMIEKDNNFLKSNN